MNTWEDQYLDLVKRIRDTGVDRDDRTGTGTRTVIGSNLRIDLAQGFPLVTTKRTHLKSIIHELLWFIRGDTNVKYLNDNGVTIWDEWADEDGDLGPVYGHVWRKWPAMDHFGCYDDEEAYVDQIAAVIKSLRETPDSRRHIVSAWNPTYLHLQALPPCHCLFQFFVLDGKLSCQLYQRSVDTFLGLPFNIASYALLTMMIAQVCELKLGEFIHMGGDVHLYHNHLSQVEELLTRTPKSPPEVTLNAAVKDIDDFKYEDIEISNYECWPSIKAPIAI